METCSARPALDRVEKSAHRLGKIGAARAAECGSTVNRVEALFGWTDGKMASYYTSTADQKRLAMAAAEKIGNAPRPHPVSRCGESPKKHEKNYLKMRWCPGEDSNLHDRRSLAPEASASTNSATWAFATLM